MRRRFPRRWEVLILLLLFAAFCAVPASAQAPERVRQLVYYANVYQGSGWQGVLYPQSEDTIYMLAGETSTLAPRITMVYFWSLTQKYLPDWSMLDEAVDADLEVRRNGVVQTVLEMEAYVIQDPTGQQTPATTELYTGEEAAARFEVYTSALDEYWEASRAYLEKLSRGELAEPPAAPRLFSTAVLSGFLIDLDAGEYQIQLIDSAGEPLPDSKKTLVIFEPRRTGVGYRIIPEARWTMPETSADPDQVIYLSGESRIFLQPHTAAEYNAFFYSKMLDPQAPAGGRSDWTWTLHAPLEAADLHLSLSGEERNLASGDYTVRQTGTGALGYEIRAYDPQVMDRISFSGFELQLSLPAGADANLWLESRAGDTIPSSQRLLRGVKEPTDWRILAPAALPLFVAGLLEIRRRRKMRKRSA